MTADLSYDGLSEAEKITGKSYKEDEATMALGFALSMDSNARKARELKDADDTHMGSSYHETLRIFRELGFNEVWTKGFSAPSIFNPALEQYDEHKILWREDGVLAHVESYSGGNSISTNNAKIYYNWRVTPEFLEDGDFYRYTSSGCFHKDSYDKGKYIYVGDHDVREGLRQKLGNLETFGKFVSPWVDQPWLWFLSYAEARESEKEEDWNTRSARYKTINQSVIAELPQNVRDAIGEYKK